MGHRYLTADVFTDQIFGGNPLAVFPHGHRVPEAQMQRVARELNLSETVFVLPPEQEGHVRRLRIFTPQVELPFAGHPPVGTAFVLASLGEIALEGDETEIVFGEGVGPVPVRIRAEGGRPVFTQLTAAVEPEVRPAEAPPEELAAILGLEPGDLLGGDHSPEAVSCGVPFLFVPVRDRVALERIQLDTARLSRHLGKAWASSLHVFAFDPERPGSDLRARMFAPTLGVPEDPATGSAAAALAGYLAPRSGQQEGTLRWVLEQGFEMGRPSLLEIEADLAGGHATAIRVGGGAVLVSDGEMQVP